MKSKKFIKSLQKGFRILQTFTVEEPGLSLSEICTATNISPGTVHRYLYTLEKLGYVKQALDTKKYWLTPRILDLGFTVLQSMDLKKRVLPYMIEVATELNVTAQCSILDGTGILFIERVRAKSVVDLEVRRETIEKIELLPLTPYTITSKKKLWEELNRVKEIGYATNNQELRESLFAVAAPIYREGKVEAALGFSLSSNLVGSGNLKERLVERLLQVTKTISAG